MVRRKLWMVKSNGVRQRVSTSRAKLKKRGYVYDRRKRSWAKPAPTPKRRMPRVKKRTFRVKRAKKVKLRKPPRKTRRGLKKLRRLRKKAVNEKKKKARLVKRKKRLETRVEKVKTRRTKRLDRIEDKAIKKQLKKDTRRIKFVEKKESRQAEKLRLKEDAKEIDRAPRVFDSERALFRQSIAINYVNHHQYYSIILQAWDKSEDKLRNLEAKHKEEVTQALEKMLGFPRSDWWFVHQYGIGYQPVPYDKFLDGRKEIRNERRGG